MASLFELYVEAGYAPELFWRLTPRQLAAQLRAAAKRQAATQALAAEAAWVGFRADHRDLKAYQAALRGQDAALPPEALAGAARAASAGLPQVTWAEFLKGTR